MFALASSRAAGNDDDDDDDDDAGLLAGLLSPSRRSAAMIGPLPLLPRWLRVGMVIVAVVGVQLGLASASFAARVEERPVVVFTRMVESHIVDVMYTSPMEITALAIQLIDTSGDSSKPLVSRKREVMVGKRDAAPIFRVVRVSQSGLVRKRIALAKWQASSRRGPVALVSCLLLMRSLCLFLSFAPRPLHRSP